MESSVQIELNFPDDLRVFQFPPALNRRLQFLLDRQDRGIALTIDERAEAEGLVQVSEILALLRLRIERIRQNTSIQGG
jgi:hypothetical protein